MLFVQRGSLVGVLAVGVVTCVLCGCSTNNPAAVDEPLPGASGGAGGSAGTGGSGGAGGSYHDPDQCYEATCNPPPCCGEPCGVNGACCDGTVCGQSGKCIPDECSFCGDLGCQVDLDACTATCNTPSCCLDGCTSDSDCCSGTRCSPSDEGVKKCFPTSCDACGGMHSACSTWADCRTECVAPSTCGQDCTTDSECGTSSECNEFRDGDKKCVPQAFQDECNACSGDVCTFVVSECDVTCPPVGAGGSGGGSGGTGGTGGLGGTGGSAGATGGGGSGGTQPTSCSACCEPCSESQPCCPGSVCDPDEDNGNKLRCIPSECKYCDYGCTFYCPS